MLQKTITKTLIASVLIALLFVGLAGCGTKTTTGPSLGSNVGSAQASLLTSQTQVKNIDVKTPKGRAELDTQINKNLKNLDQSLQALDNSLGKI